MKESENGGLHKKWSLFREEITLLTPRWVGGGEEGGEGMV